MATNHTIETPYTQEITNLLPVDWDLTIIACLEIPDMRDSAQKWDEIKFRELAKECDIDLSIWPQSRISHDLMHFVAEISKWTTTIKVIRDAMLIQNSKSAPLFEEIPHLVEAYQRTVTDKCQELLANLKNLKLKIDNWIGSYMLYNEQEERAERQFSNHEEPTTQHIDSIRESLKKTYWFSEEQIECLEPEVQKWNIKYAQEIAIRFYLKSRHPKTEAA